MRRWIIVLIVSGLVAAALHHQGLLPLDHLHALTAEPGRTTAPKSEAGPAIPAISVTVTKVQPVTLHENVLVTGNLVARTEVLVAPEVEGLRVLELLAEAGDRVDKGDVLARLEQQTLKVLLAQNDAALTRADAAIARASSNIKVAEARKDEMTKALERAKPLRKSGVLAESVLEQRRSAALGALATLAAARDGLALAEAEQAQIEAQRREILWKLEKTEVRAPTAGTISRRSARVGAVATGASVAKPMFRMIANGEIELEADVPETELARLEPGQSASVWVAGNGEVTGKVRLVLPEIDPTTRQGRARIALPSTTDLRIGSFARARIRIKAATGLAAPLSAVLFRKDGAVVQLVEQGRIVTRGVETGLVAKGLVMIRAGLEQGDTVVTKAGTFLRAGDVVRPVPSTEPVTADH